jgi:chorismate mutase/prephenate dehydratase
MKRTDNPPWCDADPEICQMRDAIDAIDDQILALINQRLNLAQRIGQIKRQTGNQVVDSTRESEVLRRLEGLNKGPLNPNVLRHIFVDIIAAARAIQASQRVAYLGPEATFTHVAAFNHFGYSVTYVSQPSIRDIFGDVEKGACNYGVVPVENAVEGSVRHTLDLFFESDLKICAERFQQVSYDLLSRTRVLKEVERVMGHPQALAQCRHWIQRYVSNACLEECGSTAFAVKEALGHEHTAAVAAAEAAAMFGLEVVAGKIEDFSRMPTRFLIIGKEKTRPTGKDKTSLMFALPHVPGALARVLEPIAEAGINLIKLESRPTRHESWSHFFFADFEGHEQDDAIAGTLEKIAPVTLYLKNLGSYPMAGVGV